MPRLIAVPPRPDFAGLTLDRPRIMGVLNVTPDSFSDGGKFAAPEAALARAQEVLAAGADIIDVGGESTRPGAVPVSLDEEKRRVIPVIRALAERGVCVSVDTRHTQVMAEAIAAGARIVNDVSALADDGAVKVIAGSKVAVILMHMHGTPGTMQQNPTYVWAPGDIFDFLKGRVEICLAAGIGLERIAVDPGIGFGKTDAHNAGIFGHLATFHGLGCALAVGASRKAFIGRMSRGEGPEARLPGSLAAAVMAAERGAHILRVHDVAETAQALAVWARLSGS
ncbi:MAG: dihydropteroate synthase [Rhodospirillaceae bacterium]|nr:dihydropteroate synthase [Rhodospirillaceae bacterium]